MNAAPMSGIASAKQVVSLQSKYDVLRRPEASRKSPSTVRARDEQLGEVAVAFGHEPKRSAIVAWIAIAAARGSGAERIGRPTTM
jgi:hypothetical protein